MGGVVWALLARACDCAPPTLANATAVVVASDDARCAHPFRSTHAWHKGGILRKTLFALGLALGRVPQHAARGYHVVKMDCDARLVRPEAALVAEVGNARYWGSCENSHAFWQARGKPVRLANGTQYPYAQGGVYALRADVAPAVLRRATAMLGQFSVHRGWEDALVGAAAASLGIPLTCSPIGAIVMPRSQRITPHTLLLHPVK